MHARRTALPPRTRLASGIGLGVLLTSGCLLTTSFDGLDVATAVPTPDARTDGATTSDAPIDGGTATDAEAGSRSKYRDAILAGGPIAYWRFGEAPGAKAAKDETGHGHDGVYSGAVGFAVQGALTGDPDTALHFDGTSSLVTLGDTFAFAGTTHFTFEAWVRPVSPPTGVMVMFARILDPDGHSFFFRPDGTLCFEREKYMADDILIGPVLPGTSFSHVVATYDGQSMSTYVNGALAAGPVPSGSIVGSATGFFVGADDFGKTDRFKGELDEAAVYDRALTGTEIFAHYKAGMGL